MEKPPIGTPQGCPLGAPLGPLRGFLGLSYALLVLSSGLLGALLGGPSVSPGGGPGGVPSPSYLAHAGVFVLVSCALCFFFNSHFTFFFFFPLCFVFFSRGVFEPLSGNFLQVVRLLDFSYPLAGTLKLDSANEDVVDW